MADSARVPPADADLYWWAYETDHGTIWYRQAREVAMAMERPDPLAPPEGYGSQPGTRGSSAQPAVNDGEVLDICGGMCGGVHEVHEIWTIGCQEGEHAGRIGYCSCCARKARQSGISCLQCLDNRRRTVPVIVTQVERVSGWTSCIPDDVAELMRETFGDQGNTGQPG